MEWQSVQRKYNQWTYTYQLGKTDFHYGSASWKWDGILSIPFLSISFPQGLEQSKTECKNII